ncbi:MAG: PAS domain-containing protein [Coriobacteriia bacterium]
MAGTRKTVKRVVGAPRTGNMPVLERAVREVSAAMPARAVYAFVLARDGAFHCVAVTPGDRPRPAHLSPQDTPGAIDIIYSRETAALQGWTEDGAVDDRTVLVPLWDDDGPVGALVMAADVMPTDIGMRMLTVHGRALGQALTRERELDTARTRIEALTRTGEMMVESIGALHEAVMVLDLDGRVKRWSAGCERLFGFTSAEAVGSILPAVRASRRPAVLRRLLDAAAHREIQRMDVEAIRKDGMSLRLHAHVLPLIDDSANAYGLMVISLPDSEQPDTPAGLHDEYLSSLVVRELTSPLTAVTGYAQLLSRSGIAEDPEQRSRITRNMLARCAEIESLLEDLSLLSGLQSAPSLSLEEVDVADMLRVLVSRLGGEHADGRFSVDRVVGSGTALVDRACAERSVLGLVRCLARTCGHDAKVAFTVNTAEGRVSLTIETEESSDDRAEALFARLEDLAQREPVTEAGLGLHLARIVAEAHGGGVSIARQPRRAPSVTIDLPAFPAGGAEENRWQTTLM